jgi:hypothetical protein
LIVICQVDNRIRGIVELFATDIDNHALAALVFGDAIAGGSKVEDLVHLLVLVAKVTGLGGIGRLTSIYVRLFRCTAATHRLSLNFTCQTPLSSVSRSLTQSPLFTFHIFKVRSDPEITFWASCWKQVIAPVCAVNVLLHCPFSGSQILSVESAAAETRRSELRSRRPTREEWPSRLKRTDPVSRDQILTRLSMEPLMQRFRL